MTNFIPEELLMSIRNSTDIVEVIGEYVQLKKQGRNYFGLCPFHGEKTPSFSVTKEKQIFYCFGCQKGGNVFTFLMEIEGYSFHEAVRHLADRSGIRLPEIPQERAKVSNESSRLLDAYEWLTKFYHHLLKYTQEGKEAYNYLKKRGINDESIERFQLGFSPFNHHLTINFLKEKGFGEQFIRQSGIFHGQQDQNLVDPFRGRITFPIRNHLGKVIAFSARSLTDERPKYINSPESDVFKKNRLLFNFDLARRHFRKQNEVILFEGQLDVISADLAGIHHVVATLGTALTENQARLLKRYVDHVTICYDADEAGLEASYTAAQRLRKAGCKVKIAQLPESLDPDNYIRKYGAESFLKRIIEPSDTYISFYMRYLKKDFNLKIEGDLLLYIQTILKEIATIDSPMEREYYVSSLSREYDLSFDTLQQEVNKYRENRPFDTDKSKQNRYTNVKSNRWTNHELLPAYHKAERQLIAYMLQNKDITDRVRQKLKASFQIDEHKIIVTHLYAYYEEYDTPDVSMFIERLQDDSLKQLVLEIAMIPTMENLSQEEMNDYIRVIQTQAQDIRLMEKYIEEQKQAEKENDYLKAAEIAMRIIEIKKQLKNI